MTAASELGTALIEIAAVAVHFPQQRSWVDTISRAPRRWVRAVDGVNLTISGRGDFSVSSARVAAARPPLLARWCKSMSRPPAAFGSRADCSPIIPV